MKLGEFEQIPTWWHQSSMDHLLEAYSGTKTGPLFFVGAGLSRSAGLPSWKELLGQLASIADQNRSSTNRYSTEIANLLASSDERRYQRAGSKLREAITAEKWRGTLEGIFATGLSPSPIHHALAQLKHHHIVTTNFDNLLEKALHKISKELPVCHPWHPMLKELEQKSETPHIFKLHGDIADSSSTIILTEEDYENLYSEENESSLLPLQTLLRSASMVIFLGFGHDDSFVAHYFQWALRGSIRKNIFAVLPRRGDPKDFSAFVAGLKASLGIQVIDYSPDDKHAELPTLLDYIAAPRSFDDHFFTLSKVRRPTVVMLYCGGTIGGRKEKGDTTIRLNVRETRFHPDLEEFATKFLAWYRPLSKPEEDFRDEIDVEWEVMPTQYQMFSENATPTFWNQLISKIDEIVYKYFQGPKLVDHRGDLVDERLRDIFRRERAGFQVQHKLSDVGDDLLLSEKSFIRSFLNRYILGIVILHGTDTLTFTANALCFALSHLPCPIVMTGANEPPDEPGLTALTRIQAESDSWKNLANALSFLQTFGHRLTEVFVCFGDTVHHPANLRKQSIDTIPFSRDLIANRDREPFLFRNLVFESEYMFKLINGVFCNNYYPKDSIPFTALIQPGGRFEDLRHIRQHPFTSPLRRPEFGYVRLKDVVRFVTVSPCFPRMTVPATLEGATPGEEVRAVVIESYPSGTYPTTKESTLVEFIWGLHDAGVPIVLISLYGMVPTEDEYEVAGRKIDVVRLYGIVVETALPLLTVVLSGVDRDEWEAAKGYDARLFLLKEGLLKYFKYHTNIITKELKETLDPVALGMMWDRVDDEMAKTAKARNEKFEHREATDIVKISRAMNIFAKGKRDPNLMIIGLLSDFLGIIDELALSHFERIGTGPQGYQTLCSVGFKLGKALSSFELRFGSWPEGRTLLSLRSSSEREKILQESNKFLERLVQILKASGLVLISLEEFDTRDGRMFLCAGDDTLGFGVTIKKPQTVGAGDRYAGVSYTVEDRRFFEELRTGSRDIEGFQEEYETLLRGTFQHDTRSIDWFVLGILRGFAASIAQTIRINDLAAESTKPSASKEYLRALQEATRCRIRVGDERDFGADIFFGNL